MRNKFTFSLLLSIVIFYTFINNSNNTSTPNVKAWNTCANAGCHTGSTGTTVDSIILMHPITGAVMTGFYPDSNYKIRMVGSNTTGTGTYPNFGFQLRGVNASSTPVGTFQTPYPANTGISTGVQMLTNNSLVSPTAGKYVVEATWKAPIGLNLITLQSVLNAVNATGTQAGDAFSTAIKSESFNVLGIVASLGCTNRRLIGNITSGAPATGVSFKVPYTAGNGGAHFGQVVTSTGVTGLTATLSAGTFASGNDSLTYTVSGTASGPGNANFAINIGLRSCSVALPVVAPAGVITSLGCSNGRLLGTLTNGLASSGVSFKLPYTGGNTGSYPSQNFVSSGVTGLTAAIAAGNFANGNDSLIFTVTGTPIGVGNANFNITIGGANCTYAATVNAVPGTITALNCASGRLLGSLMNGTPTLITDSFKIPYTGGNGGSYSTQIVNSIGVTGLTATLNAGTFKSGNDSVTYSISGTPASTGNATFALNIGGRSCNFVANVAPPIGVLASLDCVGGSISGTLSNGIAANSVSFTIPYTGGNAGTYKADTINSTTVTGLKAITQAGLFANGAGSITYTVTGIPSGAGSADFSITRGGQTCAFSLPVNAGLIAAIDCGSGSTTGSAIAGASSSGLSFSIPYSGGNGAAHSGQNINSTNITGLTASLSPGSFATGAGNLIYNIVGTPNAVGNANFAVNIGGKNCVYTVTVGAGAVGNLNCGSGTTTGMLMSASPASGVSFDIPYTGGNGGLHVGQTVTSNGLTAVLASGNFASGSGSLTYFISGTPTSSGSADFLLNIGGKSCLYSIPVSPAVGVISALNCPNGTTVGSLTATILANGVSFSIPYTGGNSGSHAGQTVSSTVVTGLTATLSSGLFANGNGNLTYNVSGTPSGAGSATFALNIGGRTCNYSITTKLQKGTIATLECGSISTKGSLKGEVVASGVSFKVPYTGGNGGTDSMISVTSTGVTGLTATKPTGVLMVGSDSFTFNVTGTPNAAGMASFSFIIDGKSCTHSILVDLPNAKISGDFTCNTGRVGTLVRSEVATGVSFTIPYTLGNRGLYAAQSINSSGVTGLTASIMADTLKSGSGSLTFNITGTPNSAGNAIFGIAIGGKTCNFDFSVIHPVGTVTTLECDSIKLTKTEDLMAQLPLPGTSIRVSYLGANGGSYSAFSIASAGVTGLTAAANAGVFTSSNGNIVLTITGTPVTSGNAEFPIVIGGKTCNYIIPVKPLIVGTINSLNCGDGKTTGVLIQNKLSNGVSFAVPYDGGNRGYHFGQTVASTGVTGLSATLASGQFAIGFGQLAYNVSGTPNAEGMANFSLNIGGKTCIYSIPVRSTNGEVMNIDCSKGQINSSVLIGTLNSGVSFTIPYQGGNGGEYGPQALTSKGVEGLSAQLAGGVLNFGDGSLKYNLSGATTAAGWANFSIKIGNQECVYGVKVTSGGSSILSASDKLEIYHSGTSIYLNNHSESLNYTIFDINGKNLKESQVKKSENSIDLRSISLPSGNYFAVFKGENTSYSLKFIVE